MCNKSPGLNSLGSAPVSVAPHPQLYRGHALDAEIAYQRWHQRHLAHAALDRKGRLQHHAHVVVLLTEVPLHEGLHLLCVFGPEGRMAKSHDRGFILQQFGHAAPTDAVPDRLGDLLIARVNRCMADGRQGDQSDAYRTDPVARRQDDVARPKAVGVH
jgi:hypothetical protein